MGRGAAPEHELLHELMHALLNGVMLGLAGGIVPPIIPPLGGAEAGLWAAVGRKKAAANAMGEVAMGEVAKAVGEVGIAMGEEGMAIGEELGRSSGVTAADGAPEAGCSSAVAAGGRR